MFSDYIVPVLVALAIAVLFAFLLSLLGEKLKVEKDPKIDRIREHLSGANCGGCGYPGCDAFAEAVFLGQADVNKCNPSSKSAKIEIAKILGKDMQISEPQVAVVHCNGGNACKTIAKYNGIDDCKYAAAVGGGLACHVGCLGFGNCKVACPENAIEIENETAFINKEKCVACGNCITQCPHSLIGWIPKSAKIYVACSNKCKGKEVLTACANGCISCGICEKNCPNGAIKLVNNIAVIDYAKCDACMECVAKCPRKCIREY